jgi:hypothetical protein
MQIELDAFSNTCSNLIEKDETYKLKKQSEHS